MDETPLTREQPTEQTGLAPCPFCGGKAEFLMAAFLPLVPSNRFGVRCVGDCGVFLDVRASSREKATELWNKRVPLKSDE